MNVTDASCLFYYQQHEDKDLKLTWRFVSFVFVPLQTGETNS